MHQTDKDGNKAGHKQRVDKKWNLDRGNGRYDHGRTVHCNWETEFRGSNVRLRQRRRKL